MAPKSPEFQSGTLLFDAVTAAFRANGSTVSRWSTENGLNYSSARAALLGFSSGKRGAEIRAQLIEAAGRPLVEMLYSRRIQDHAAAIKKGAA
jgi:hypothetical protein